jgi:hypothetical protein
MIAERFSEYRVMWLMVLFDLPTETKKDIREYAKFRKRLLQCIIRPIPVQFPEVLQGTSEA